MRRQLRELEADLARLGRDGFCADPREIAREALQLLTPPERISTTESASRYRLLPNAEGGARLWSATKTPYINGIQDALDDPLVPTVAVPGAARTGKTLAPENHLHKRMMFGPMTDVLWYLPGGLLDDYIDTTVAPMFDLHPPIAAKLGKGKSDNKRALRKVAGRFIRYLAGNLSNFRGKQAPLIVVDEIDGLPKRLRNSIRSQIAIRGRAYGSLAKSYLCSHPDTGWEDGIAAIWLESTRGLWFWQCPFCGFYSSPCPTADWRMKLTYERPRGVSTDEALEIAERTAGMLCPHCGETIENDHKEAMSASGVWVHEGQTIALDGTVTGTVTPNDTWGFWIHGTMSPFVTWGKLAREFRGAEVSFERTGKTDRLKEITAKSGGEVYEGPSGKRTDAKMLRARMAGDGEPSDADLAAAGRYRLGTVPPWVRYITATVDTGGNKFDIAFIGWGADAESCLIQRETRVALADGTKLQPPLRQEHWNVLKTDVLLRRFPIQGRPGWHLPVAIMLFDVNGAPGTTDKGREFARRMQGDPAAGANGYRVRPIMGTNKADKKTTDKRRPEVGAPRPVTKDAQGKVIEPTVYEWDLGVHRLKKTVSERMAIDAPGAGFMHLPWGGDPRWADEMTNERLVDDEFVRSGPNETFDLWVYAEAARLMLKPDRAEIDWSRPPEWARPVEIKAPSTTAAPAPPPDPDRERAARRARLLDRMPR